MSRCHFSLVGVISSTLGAETDNKGLNFNCVEGVVPSMVSEQNPAKYEPISCGDWCQLRFKLENHEMKRKLAQAPSAVVVDA